MLMRAWVNSKYTDINLILGWTHIETVTYATLKEITVAFLNTGSQKQNIHNTGTVIYF